MEEFFIINGFLWLRVLLIGGVMLFFPRISRKGLLFGIYVGEEFAESDQARSVLRQWDRRCIIVMATAIIIGLIVSLSVHAVSGNLTGTAVLILGGIGCYLRTYADVKSMDRPDVSKQAKRAIAVLESDHSICRLIAKCTLGICLLASIATLIYVWICYQSMSDQIPKISKLIVVSDRLVDKSLLLFLYIPIWNLFLSVLYAVLGTMISSAKRSFRDEQIDRSVYAQNTFRSTNAIVFSGMALLICSLLSFYSIQCARIGLGEIHSFGTGLLWMMGSIIFYGLVCLFLLIKRFGQGGSIMEQSTDSAGDRLPGSLTGGLADNEHWYCGVLYVNRNDSCMMVESRFGIGYTMNYGNTKAIAFTIVVFMVLIGLITLGFYV